MSVLGWLNEWTQTAGFAGIAAVIAAVIAYLGVRRTNRNDAEVAAANQWWDQARWASERLGLDDQSVAIGLAAFDELLEAAPGSKAAGFVRAAMRAVIERGRQADEPAAAPEPAPRRANRRKAAELFVAASERDGSAVPEHIRSLATAVE
jgi:hypothetical protein